jgi:hypothetical protein
MGALSELLKDGSKKEEEPKGDLKASAAKAVRKAIEAEDDDKLAEALSIFIEACASKKADKDDEDEEY